MGSERPSISAPLDKFHATSYAGRISHMGPALYRKVQEIGISGKYQAVDGFRLWVKTADSLAPLRLEEVVEGYGLT